MTLKYNNQLKISLDNYQKAQIKTLAQIHGCSMQDIIRKALDAYAQSENGRLLRTNPHARPLPGF
ncbi:MAG: hypothetical protein ACK5XN_39990 [Bacteroidota bacterium]|jgi:hypothetical protein